MNNKELAKKVKDLRRHTDGLSVTQPRQQQEMSVEYPVLIPGRL